MDIFKKYVTMIQEDIREAMKTRNGQDELSNFIILIGFIFVVISLFTKKPLFVLAGAVFIVWSYIRIFSKNVSDRKKENAFYMKYMGKIVSVVDYFWMCIKMKFKSLFDKEYAYFVCNKCKQIVRIPKGKNKINIRCPKCGNTFVRRT